MENINRIKDNWLKIIFFLILLLALNTSCGIPGADPEKAISSKSLIEHKPLQSFSYSKYNCINEMEGAIIWWREKYNSEDEKFAAMKKVPLLAIEREKHLKILRVFKKNPINSSSIDEMQNKLENDPNHPDCDLEFFPEDCDPDLYSQFEKLNKIKMEKQKAEIESLELLREIHKDHAKVEPVDPKTSISVFNKKPKIDLVFNQELVSFKNNQNDPNEKLGLWYRSPNEKPHYTLMSSGIGEQGRKLHFQFKKSPLGFTKDISGETLIMELRRYDDESLNTVMLRGDIWLKNSSGEILRKGKLSFEGVKKSCQ